MNPSPELMMDTVTHNINVGVASPSSSNNAGVSTQQYKHKRKFINKFFSEPVEALDLTLTKAEEIFSMEEWVGNPLKQEMNQTIKIEIPALDYSEVQLVDSPKESPQDSFNQPKSNIPPLIAKYSQVSPQSLPLNTRDIQRVILKPSQEAYKNKSPRSPYAPLRYSPYHTERCGSPYRSSTDIGYTRPFLTVPSPYYVGNSPTGSPNRSYSLEDQRKSLNRSEIPGEPYSSISKANDLLCMVSSPEDSFKHSNRNDQNSPRHSKPGLEKDSAELSWAKQTVQRTQRISQHPQRISVIENSSGYSKMDPDWLETLQHRRLVTEGTDLDTRIAMMENSSVLQNPLAHGVLESLDTRTPKSPPLHSSRSSNTSMHGERLPCNRLSPKTIPRSYFTEVSSQKNPFLRHENPNLGSFHITPSEGYIRRSEELIRDSMRIENPQNIFLNRDQRDLSGNILDSARFSNVFSGGQDRNGCHGTDKVQSPISNLHERKNSVIVHHRSDEIKSEVPDVTEGNDVCIPQHLPFVPKDFSSWLNLQARMRLQDMFRNSEKIKSGGGPVHGGVFSNNFNHGGYLQSTQFSNLNFDNKASRKFFEPSSKDFKTDKDHHFFPKNEYVKDHVSRSLPQDLDQEMEEEDEAPESGHAKGKRGRPRKHAPKVPLPPLYVFIRNLLHNPAYNPSVVTWVDESTGCFKVTSTIEFAKTWGKMKSNR